MKRQRMKQNGFTLIETTVAMLVMMIVGLSATSLFLYSIRYNSGASQRSTAMAVAQQRLEEMRALDYSDTGLAFGVRTPETVVIAPIATANYTPGSSIEGGGQPSESVLAASSFNPNVVPNAPATPTPSPTPTTGGAAPANSTSYRVQTRVDPFPIGVAAAAATQKQITIRVTPINGSGSSSWVNQSAVEVVFRRSFNVPGPYKQ